VLPYFKYKSEEQKASHEIELLKMEQQKLTEQYTHYQGLSEKLKANLDNIKYEIHYFPDNLARSLSFINSSGSNASPMQQQLQNLSSGNVLGIPDSITNYNKRVKWYINNWFDGIVQDINDQVVNPAIELKSDSGSIAINDLDTLTANAIRQINDYIATIDENFWHSYYDGKIPVARNLESVVEESFNPIFTEIETFIKDTEHIQSNYRSELKKDSVAIAQFKVSIKKLEERIDSVESPIGKIPLNLVDFVQLFPILIIILIVMLTNYCIKCMKLAANIKSALFKTEIGKNNMSIQNITDCWFLPPYGNIFQILLLVISVLLIVGIYILSILHVINHSEMFISFTGAEESLNRNLFFMAYGIGILIFFGCFWFIQKQNRLTNEIQIE
jgi:hypothetical protein